MPPTDDAEALTVLAVLRYCAASWVPEARIVGNIRAGDIVRSLEPIISKALAAGVDIPDLSIEDIVQSYDPDIEGPEAPEA
ncbi:hypothetical protein [Defluviimonas salinarum]|uniref:Uncharacterized protein n=1 Tax=Defluviimonas salinarum TaxID=2992147 RepID=A0ABT3J7A4_9RHOB|nr:hypothetical protein [Defluviimonas salinarum]MCW3783559.1 hypothetical protein [Defluviimonas salinarum]